MVTPVGSFAPVSYGNWSLRTKFLRRTTARSSLSSRATVSIVRSRMNAAHGRPAPRIGVLGTAFVNTTSSVTSTEGIAYAPGNGTIEVIGRSSP